MRASKQAIFLDAVNTEIDHANEELRNAGEEENPDTLQLTQQEADILRDIAGAVNIAYDPGNEITPEKRTFRPSDVFNKPPTKTVESF
jgi:hypothetical protein